jgi:hypothetical protein
VNYRNGYGRPAAPDMAEAARARKGGIAPPLCHVRPVAASRRCTVMPAPDTAMPPHILMNTTERAAMFGAAQPMITS